MGAKAKKSLRKKLTKKSQVSAARRANKQSSDFLPLEVGQATELPKEEIASKATVIYIGHIPHGFYEEQMEGFFKQFGKVKRLRIARSKKTGRSKHYGFLEFENPEVAKVVADEINNYLVFEHNLQIHLIPPEKIHPKLWRRVTKTHDPHRRIEFERRRHNKERSAEEQEKLVKRIMKRDERRRKRIKDAGIDYECPAFVGQIQPANKKIKFADEDAAEV